MSTEGGTKAVIAAAIANAGIALTKFLAFLATGSSSMLSEAIHSLADTGNQFLLLIGGKRSRRAPDPEHQFGYGRTRYVYSFVVAIILFMLVYYRIHGVIAVVTLLLNLLMLTAILMAIKATITLPGCTLRVCTS